MKKRKGKETTSISGRHATGNAHQHVTQKKSSGKYPIQKGIRKKAKAKGNKGTSMRERWLLFAHFHDRNTGYLAAWAVIV